MAQRLFIVLKYTRSVPMMAGCAGCQRKFFTPLLLGRDQVGAQGYLLKKVDQHKCKDEVQPRGTVPT
jgi:hypothetical protein